MACQGEVQLGLRSELARMTREARVRDWLADAHTEIETWRHAMPGAERIRLHSALKSDGELDIRAWDGWREVGIGLYAIDGRSVRFFPGHPQLLPNAVIESEPAFISHLLQLLRKRLAIGD